MVQPHAGVPARVHSGGQGKAEVETKSGPGPLRPPGALSTTRYHAAVLQPWLKERQAQDLRGGAPTPAQLTDILRVTLSPAARLSDAQIGQAVRSICRALPSPLPGPLLQALVRATQASAHAQAGFDLQWTLARMVLAHVADPATVTTAAAREQHLKMLLDAVLTLDERTDREPVMFTAWYVQACEWLGADAVVPATLRLLGACRLPSADAVLNLVARIGLQQMHALADQPGQVVPQLGQVVWWLLRQAPEVRGEGLAGLGMGLNASRFFAPRHLCEMLQAISGLSDEIDEREQPQRLRDIQRLVDALGGDDGFGAREVAAVVGSLRTRGIGTPDGMPPEEAVATLRGLFIGTLHPQQSVQQIREHLPRWSEVGALPGLAADHLQAVGQALGQALGGEDMAPAVLRALVGDLAADTAQAALRAAPVLRGLLRAVGAPGLVDAHLAAVASALGQAPGSAGTVLVPTLADTLGVLGVATGPAKSTALRSLEERLERLLPAPFPGPLRTGLALVAAPLSTLVHQVPAADSAACADAAFGLPGLLDDAMLARQWWACVLHAGTDAPLVLRVADRLLAHAGARITPARFRELRAALLAQVVERQDEMAQLYRHYAQVGRFDAPVGAAPARKAGGKGFGPNRASGPGATARRHEGAQKFLREEAALLGRGLAGRALGPLVAALKAQATELAGMERKR